MAQGNVGVDISVVESTAAFIREKKTEMRSNLTAVSEGVTNLQNSWQSDAGNQLASIASNMSSKFAALAADVEKFATFLDGVAANYKSTEQQNRESMSGVSGMFNG